MRPAFLSATICIAALVLGCSTTSERPHDHLHSSHGHLSDPDRPLLPRRTAKETWADSKSPLPPLPDRYRSRTDTPVGAAPEPLPETTTHDEDKVARLKEIAPTELGVLVDSYRGKVLVLNCWGIDCGPCVEELPHLNKIFKEKAEDGLAIAAISTDVESRHKEVEEFVAKQGYDFDVYLRAPGSDTQFRRAIDPDYSADPFTIVFDKQGVPVATIADALPESEWRKVIDAALAGEQIPITDPEVVRLF